MDNKKLVSGEALKALIDIVKPEVQNHEARLGAMENVAPSLVTCDKTVTALPDNVNNNIKLTNVQGKTLQNICNYKDYRIGGQTATVTNITDVENGLLFKPASATALVYGANTNLMQCGKTYTIICDYKQHLTNATHTTFAYYNGSGYAINGKALQVTNDTETRMVVPITILENDTPRAITIGYHGAMVLDTDYIQIRNLMVLEGDWTNKEIPSYFEGIQSVQNPLDVQVTGKNLFDITTPANEYYNNTFFQNKETDYDFKIVDNGISVKPSSGNAGVYVNPTKINVIGGEKITFKADVISGTLRFIVRPYLSDGTLYTGNANGMNYLSSYNAYYTTPQSNPCTITVPNGVTHIQVGFCAMYNASEALNIINNVMVERGAVDTSFEPYIQPHNYKLPFDGELRSLPNGVCDEIKDGKLIRRVGKHIVDGSEAMSFYSTDTTTNTSRFGVRLTDYKYYLSTSINVITDYAAVYRLTETVLAIDAPIVGLISTDNQIRIRVLKSNLETDNLSGFKKWVANNPITLYYELVEPEIIELETIYNNPVIKAYANGNIIQNNAPIHPTLTFAYQTGLQGKINDLQVEVEQHESELRNMLVNETGLQTVTERVNDLVMQDGNIKLEEIQGRTLQNIIEKVATNKGTEKGTSSESNGYLTVETLFEGQTIANVYGRFATNLLKANTTYTVIFNELTHSSKLIAVLIGDGDANSTVAGREYLTNKNYIVINTTNYVPNHLAVYFGEMVVGEKAKIDNNILVLEGDWTGKEIPPYFTGIKSVGEEGELQVRTTGKNLFNIDSLLGRTYSGVTLTKDDDGYYVLNGTCTGSSNFQTDSNYLEKGTYTLSANNLQHNDINVAIVQVHSNSGAGNITCNDNAINSTATASIKSSYNYLFRVRIENGKTYSNYKFKPQLEMNNVATEYEPYQESVATWDIEPLRALPNGVCDEIAGNKIVRRVGSAVLDGSSDEEYGDSLTTIDTNFRLTISYKNLPDIINNNGNIPNIICDKLLVGDRNAVYNATTLGISQFNDSKGDVGHLYVTQPLSILNGTETITGFRTYLQNNPVTIVYELQTPVIEEIPSTMLKTFANGHIICDNDITPTEITIKYADSLIARIEQIEETQQYDNQTLRNLCDIVDVLCLQIGELMNQ